MQYDLWPKPKFSDNLKNAFSFNKITLIEDLLNDYFVCLPTLIFKRSFVGKLNISFDPDFNYISDVVAAFVMIMKSKKAAGKVFNVGNNKKISVLSLCSEIFKIMNIKKKIRINSKRKRPKLSEVDNLQASNKNIKKLVSWKPKVKLELGLKLTIDWFKKKGTKNFKQYII